MLNTAFSKSAFSEADAAHHAPYTQISFATQQSSSTAADVSALTLSNVVLCSVGEAEGWGLSIDAKFVTDMVKDIKANMKKGVKSNLRHNSENAGFQLGRITNVRVDGDRVLGDLACYKSANISPLAPGMATWLVELVAEDPEAMMMSIKSDIAYCFQKDENGNEIRVWEYNADDIWISPNYEMPIYCAYGGIQSCDAVAGGALTEAMFSKPSNQTGLLTQLTKTIKNALNFGKKDPEDDDTDFFPKAPSVVAAKNTQDMKDNTEPTAPTAVEFAAVQTKVIELTTERDTLTASVAERDTKIVELSASVTAVTAERDTLTASVAERDTTIIALTAEVERLKLLPGDEHAGGDTDTTPTKPAFGKYHEQLKAERGLK